MPETIAIALDPACVAHDMGPRFPESPERLRTLMELLDSPSLQDVSLLRLPERVAGHDALRAVHTEAFIDKIRATEGQTVLLDTDTIASPGSYESALRASGSAMEAVDAVYDGRANRSFALVRPPGHHAEPFRAMGFCLFNSAAVAAAHARANHGAERVAVIDFDVHHGNGTQAAFWDDPRSLYISTHQSPLYPGTGAAMEVGGERARGTILNVPLGAGHGDRTYDAIYGGLLMRVLEQFQPDLIIASAGFDLMAADPLGGMRVSPDGVRTIAGHLAQAADRLCDGRLVMTLEGGYNLDNLRAGVAACLIAMAADPRPAAAMPDLRADDLGDARHHLDLYRHFYTL